MKTILPIIIFTLTAAISVTRSYADNDRLTSGIHSVDNRKLFVASPFTVAQLRFCAISNIEKKGAWYCIYNEHGKKIKTLSVNIGKIEGFSARFFIVSRGAWYYLYDEQGKRYKTLSASTGKIVSVSGDTFVVKKGAWTHTYNREGKRIATR
jgi:hypothetical protein